MTHEFDIKTFDPPWDVHPWIGRRYIYRELHGLNILILTRFHYAQALHKEHSAIASVDWHSKQSDRNFFVEIAKLLLGRSRKGSLSLMESEWVWSKVAYHSYIQEFGRPKKTTPGMWHAAKEPFQAVLGELKPDLIIVRDRRVYDEIPKSPGGIPCWHVNPVSSGAMSSILDAVNAARGRLRLPMLRDLCLQLAVEEEDEESELLEAVNEVRDRFGLPAWENLEVENKYERLDETLEAVNGVRHKAELPELSYPEFQEAAADTEELLAEVNAVREELGLEPLLSVFV